MSHRFARCLSQVASIALLLCLLSCGPLSAYGQAADEAALRSLTEKFFAAFGKPDLDALMGLWSEKSPDYVASRKSLQESFVANRIEIKSATIGKVTTDGDKASLRLVVDSSAVDVKTGKPVSGFGKLNRTLHFIKEIGQWKIARYVSSEEELAAAIAATKTEAEGKALLEVNKELHNIELQRALIAQGLRLANQGGYAQTMVISELALSLAQELNDQPGVSAAFRSIAYIHRLQGRYAKALEYLQKSLKISEEIGDRVGLGSTLGGIGNVYIVQGNHAQGLEYNLKSLKIKEETDDKPGMGTALASIGSAYQNLNDYPKSLEYLHRSLKIREELGDRQNIAVSLGTIAITHYYQGNYAQSLEHHQRSLKIREELGDKPGIAATLNNMALILRVQCNFLRAIEYYQRSLEIKQQIGDKPGIGNSLGNLGVVHYMQGNFAQALEYHRRSLKIAEEIGNRVSIGASLNNIGIIHQVQGNYSEALENYHRSVKLKEEIGDRSGISVTFGNIGAIHNLQGNYSVALEYYQRSVKIKEEIGDQGTIAFSLHGLGTVKKSQGNYAEALEILDRAVVTARRLGRTDIMSQARTTMGQVHRALNQHELARQAFAESIDAIEDLRDQVAGAAPQQQQFFETKLLPYQEMIDLLVAQNNHQEALAFAERSKGRALLDVLSRGKINITKAMSAAEQQQEATLTAELVSLNSQVYAEKQRKKPDATQLANLTARLEKTRLRMDALQTNLYAAHPELRIQRGEIRALTPAEAAALIPDTRTALLEFVVQDKQAFLFVLTRNKQTGQAAADLKVYPLNIKQKDLADLTRRFNQRITSRSLGFQELAAQLYDLLLKPAQAQLHAVNNLVIVPDGVLWELPFQALLSAPRRFLLENFAISYAPSLTVLKEMNALQAKRTRRKPQAKTLLALGNPAIGAQTAEKVTAVYMDEKLLPLPDAERQVKALQQIYGSQNSKVYIGTDASEERLKQEAGRYEILHLATHGILNDASPMYSHLVLSQLQGQVSDDGLLEAWEIMKLDLNADLVILSACDTARGRVGAGEGMIGLAWGLFVAGSPTTVVSQWKVETESNSELMVAFHRNLRLKANNAKAPAGKAEALRQAALRLMKNKKYSHPFYWAPFVIVGAAN